jgi:uncharacterized protein YebE (UPF0316 family)
VRERTDAAILTARRRTVAAPAAAAARTATLGVPLDIDALFSGPIGPLLIFALRIVDVSFSTVRILLSVRNQRVAVPIIGFFEVLIWLFAAGNAIRHLESPLHLLGYAAGFSTGTMVGLWIEEKLAIGLATMRIISKRTDAQLATNLRALGCGVTEFIGQGREGPVDVVYTVVQRRDISRVLDEVERVDADAFITVEEPREIRRGWMYSTPRRRLSAGIGMDDWMRRTVERMPHRRTGAAEG